MSEAFTTGPHAGPSHVPGHGPAEPGVDPRVTPRRVHPDSVIAVTGHPGVDEVLASLDELGDRPVTEHVAVFESAHRRLRDALTEPDAASRPAPTGPGPRPPSTGQR